VVSSTSFIGLDSYHDQHLWNRGKPCFPLRKMTKIGDGFTGMPGRVRSGHELG
jgi:hypothetical protein